MRAIALDACLGLAVLSLWIGCFGFLRLRTVLDRLHCVTFVAASAGPLIALAAFVDEGITVRSVKLLALVVLVLVTSAASVHATGRALLLRDGPAER